MKTNLTMLLMVSFLVGYGNSELNAVNLTGDPQTQKAVLHHPDGMVKNHFVEAGDQLQKIYLGGTKTAEITADGEVWIGGDKAGSIESNGDIVVAGTSCGQITAEGEVWMAGDQVGEITADGEAWINGEEIGEIEADGTIWIGGTAEGSYEGGERNHAALVVFFDFFDRG